MPTASGRALFWASHSAAPGNEMLIGAMSVAAIGPTLEPRRRAEIEVGPEIYCEDPVTSSANLLRA